MYVIFYVLRLLELGPMIPLAAFLTSDHAVKCPSSRMIWWVMGRLMLCYINVYANYYLKNVCDTALLSSSLLSSFFAWFYLSVLIWTWDYENENYTEAYTKNE